MTMVKNRRRTLQLFILLTATDMLLNFPNHFLNIIHRYAPAFMTTHQHMMVHCVGYVLWHCQFIVSSFCIRLPLFKRTPKRKASSIATQSTTITVSNCLRYSLEKSERNYTSLWIHHFSREVQLDVIANELSIILNSINWID